MTRWIAGLATAAALCAGSALAQQPSELVTIWSCRDKDGLTHVTNLQSDTVGKDCRIVQQQRVTVAPRSTNRQEQQDRKASNRGAPLPARNMGTAFAIAKDVLLTNHHVIASCQRIRTEPDGAVAKVIASDKTLDLAALRTTLTFADFARISSVNDVALGQDVVVAGFPLPGLLSQGLNITTGTVSAVAGLRDDIGTYQITAPIQSGNSGGPVLDKSGLVIGVVVGKLNEIAVANVTGSLPQNVNFAISLKAMRRFLRHNDIPTTEPSATSKRDVADIAASAKGFTVPITCAR